MRYITLLVTSLDKWADWLDRRDIVQYPLSGTGMSY